VVLRTPAAGDPDLGASPLVLIHHRRFIHLPFGHTLTEAGSDLQEGNGTTTWRLATAACIDGINLPAQQCQIDEPLDFDDAIQ